MCVMQKKTIFVKKNKVSYKLIKSYTIYNAVGGVCTIEFVFADDTTEPVTFNSKKMDHFTAALIMLKNWEVSFDAETKIFKCLANENLS